MIDIVCIDDETALLRILSVFLESRGFSVATFEDPSEGVDFINQNEVGLVLCDQRMPSMTGLDVLKAVDAELPFYLVSGDLKVSAVSADDPRLCGVLAKPVSPRKLAELAEAVLGR